MMKIPNLKAKAKNSETNTRAFPLLVEKNIKNHDEVIKLLDVEKSKRYQPTATSTYCNIYAHDFAHVWGAFIPRTWWNERALKNNIQEPIYGETVLELNANQLYVWFQEHGKKFGWHQVESMHKAQELADNGKLVTIVAANLDAKKSGHITIVVPQTEQFKATGAKGLWQTVINTPVQSQAGRINKARFVGSWWERNHKKPLIYEFRESI